MLSLSEKPYAFTQTLLKLYYEEHKQKDQLIEPNRIIGNTDYKKYDSIAKQIEREETMNKSQFLQLANPNDIKKQKQIYEGETRSKMEAAKIFKTEGDDCLKSKRYNEAINAYEKALLQLYYRLNDDGEEEQNKKVEQIKIAINLNLSYAFINMEKYQDAIGYLIEAKRVDKNNLKIFYRLAYCYMKTFRMEDAKSIINDGLTIDYQNKELNQLKHDIFAKEEEMDNQMKKKFKKLINTST